MLCRLAGVPPAAVAAAASAVEASGDSTRLLVLDAGTGRRVAERDLPSATVSVVPFGRDVVVTEVLADSRAQVERQDPVTGEARWSFRSTDPLKTPASGPVWLFPLVQHGVIVANGPVTWAFSADGRVLGEWHLQGGDWAVRGGWGLDVSVLADGRFAVGESGGVGLSDQDYGTVSRTDARDGFSIPGPVLEPVADDGSASDVLFLRPTGIGGMVAMAPTSGRLLWKAGVQPWGDALVLDSRLIVVNGRDLSAIDARSGQVLWTTRVAMGNHEQRVLTDGRSVFVPRFDALLGAVLTAFDPADGREQWTARLPAGASRLAVVHGHLVAMTAQELVALG